MEDYQILFELYYRPDDHSILKILTREPTPEFFEFFKELVIVNVAQQQEVPQVDNIRDDIIFGKPNFEYEEFLQYVRTDEHPDHTKYVPLRSKSGDLDFSDFLIYISIPATYSSEGGYSVPEPLRIPNQGGGRRRGSRRQATRRRPRLTRK
jgi:hypothetical protein